MCWMVPGNYDQSSDCGDDRMLGNLPPAEGHWERDCS